jgi:hypothetical protein
VPPANYSHYYLVFDKERISPAYKLSFRLNNETEDFQKQLQEAGKDPGMTSKEMTKIRQDTSHIGKTLAIMDLCKKEGHQKKALDFFCVDCNRGLCTTCLIRNA